MCDLVTSADGDPDEECCKGGRCLWWRGEGGGGGAEGRGWVSGGR